MTISCNLYWRKLCLCLVAKEKIILTEKFILNSEFRVILPIILPIREVIDRNIGMASSLAIYKYFFIINRIDEKNFFMHFIYAWPVSNVTVSYSMK